MAFLIASPLRIVSPAIFHRCTNRSCISRRYRPRTRLSSANVSAKLASSVTTTGNVHKTTLSAVTAIFGLVARGLSGSVRIDVKIVGVLVRGLTHASCAHPEIAPLSQEPKQAHSDICRRGLELERKSNRTVKEDAELALLDTTAHALDERKFAYGDHVMFFTVVDDHPQEDWLTVNIQAPKKKMSNPIGDFAQYPNAEESVRGFVDSLIANQHVCPYTESAEIAAVGAASLTPAPIRYITDTATATCAAFVYSTLSASSEILQTPIEELSTVLLLLPHFGDFQAFSATSAYMSDVFAYCGIRELVDIVLFHPQYDRAALNCDVELIGHLPPPGQLASRALATSRDGSVQFTPQELAEAANFARKAPVPVVNILRAQQLQALSASNAHGTLYVRNAEKLAAVGVKHLSLQLDGWMRLARGGDQI